MTFFTKGLIEVSQGNHSFTAQKNDLLLLEPGESFFLEQREKRTCAYFNIGLAPIDEKGMVLQKRSLGLTPLSRPSNAAQMTKLCQQLSTLFRDKRNRYRLQECSIIGLRILLLMEPLMATAPLPTVGRDNRNSKERILDIIDTIATRYKERLTVEGFAKETGMHPSRFSRLFKETVGISPQRYIMEKKIAKAKDFIQTYKESLTTTAAELGFHDYAHFFKSFKKITGQSPNAFQNKIARPLHTKPDL